MSLTILSHTTFSLPISGSAAAPSLYFGGASNNTGAGIYGTAIAVSISAAGVNQGTFDANGLTVPALTSTGAITGTSFTGAIVATTGTFSSTLSVTGALTVNSTNFTQFIVGAGAPTNGTTGANASGIGSLYSDVTNGILYINTGTKVSPTWTKVGTQS